MKILLLKNFSVVKWNHKLLLFLKFTLLMLLFYTGPISAQQKTVTGTVLDAQTNEPLIGVTIRIKGTTLGCLTGVSGTFSLNLPNPDAILVFSFIGYETMEEPLNGRNNLAIKLSIRALGLDEVVIVGYGTQKKESITGAISSIKAATLLSSPNTNTTNSLTGRLPGLTTVQTTGKPGYDAALLYVRGIATTGTATAIVIVDGIERASGVGGIDPNEIETINILKDASATAVYGIKGANGVIVVTTKRGFEGKARISISTNVGIQTLTGIPAICNAYNAAVLKNEALKNDGLAPWFDASELQKFKDHSDPIWYPDVNWYKTLIKKYTPETSTNINIQGGSKIAKYFVSIGYTYQDGMEKEFPQYADKGFRPVNNYTRYNIRTNLDLNLTKNLKVSLNLGGQLAKTYDPGNGNINWILGRVIEVPAFAFPIEIPGAGPTPGLSLATNTSIGNNLHNSVALLSRYGYTLTENDKIESTINLNYKLDDLVKGLSYRATVAYDSYYDLSLQSNADVGLWNITDRKNQKYQASTTWPYSESWMFGIYTVSNGGTNKLDIQTGFDYSNSFGMNNITGLLLANRQLVQIAGADAVNALQGFVGRVTYDYAKMYFAEFDGSYNGSENFSKSKRYGFFPAVSLGYSIHESLLRDVPWIDILKIRGSYGIVGNDKIGTRFLYLNNYSVTSGGVQFGDVNSLTGYPIIYHSRIGNDQVTWERGTKRNIGFESSFFNNSLGLTFDVFDETRTDILISTPQSRLVQYGESYPAINIGKVYNKGYEIEFHYGYKFGELITSLNLQLSYSKNKILNIDEPFAKPDYQKQAGKSIGQFQGYLTQGFYADSLDIATSPVNTLGKPVPGDLKYMDYNKDGKITTDDMVFMGYPSTPRYNYSLAPTISWKGFTIDLMFQGVAQVSSNVRFTENNNGNNFFDFQLNRWTPETAATATWPTLHSLGNAFISYKTNDYLLQNTSYIKFRNAQISWQIPTKWTSKLKLSELQIYFNGQNLHTWSKFMFGLDPEMASSSGYPLARVYNVGLKVQF